MINKSFRRFVWILSVLALSPNYGFAGVFGDLYAGPSRAAVLPVPVPSAVAEDFRAGAAGHYLQLSGLDLTQVPAAPAPGSAQDKADMKTLFDWQTKRTGAQCAQARAELSHSYEVFFGRINPLVSLQPAAVTRFFKNTAKDSVAAHTYLKDAYQRPRPFERDARLKPCVMRVLGFSYPSGHAAMARLFALILGDLVPARRAEFMARAEEVALNRVISGVHHPTDIAAGKTLADVLYRELLKKPAFKAEMQALRAQLR